MGRAERKRPPGCLGGAQRGKTACNGIATLLLSKHSLVSFDIELSLTGEEAAEHLPASSGRITVPSCRSVLNLGPVRRCASAAIVPISGHGCVTDSIWHVCPVPTPMRLCRARQTTLQLGAGQLATGMSLCRTYLVCWGLHSFPAHAYAYAKPFHSDPIACLAWAVGQLRDGRVHSHTAEENQPWG